MNGSPRKPVPVGASVGVLTVGREVSRAQAPNHTPESYFRFTLRLCKCQLCGLEVAVPDTLLRQARDRVSVNYTRWCGRLCADRALGKRRKR